MPKLNGPSPGFMWTLLFIGAAALAVYIIVYVTGLAKGMLW